MDIKTRIKTLISEAELYRTQGLFSESRKKYESASALIAKIDKLKNKDSLLQSIDNKIKGLDSVNTRVEKGPSSPELSNKAQNLIKDLFSFSKKNQADQNVLEGAVALAKFGQFERAMAELESLLEKESTRVDAAKNILRCKIAALSPKEAVAQYNNWHSQTLFTVDQLENVRQYLNNILEKKGIKENLPLPVATTDDEESRVADFVSEVEDTEEEFLDITSIGITFESGIKKGKMIEFDVNFQSGNTLSLIVSSKDKSLIENMQTGIKLNDIQFYSPIAIFKGKGIVLAKTQIKSGPKEGDFCLDIKMVSN